MCARVADGRKHLGTGGHARSRMRWYSRPVAVARARMLARPRARACVPAAAGVSRSPPGQRWKSAGWTAPPPTHRRWRAPNSVCCSWHPPPRRPGFSWAAVPVLPVLQEPRRTALWPRSPPPLAPPAQRRPQPSRAPRTLQWSGGRGTRCAPRSRAAGRCLLQAPASSLSAFCLLCWPPAPPSHAVTDARV